MTIAITCTADRLGVTDRNLDRAIADLQEHGTEGAWGADISYNETNIIVTVVGKLANTLSANGELPLAQELANKIVNQAFSVMLAIKGG